MPALFCKDYWLREVVPKVLWQILDYLSSDQSLWKGEVQPFSMLSSVASSLVLPFDRERSPVLDTETGISILCSCGMDCLLSFCHL